MTQNSGALHISKRVLLFLWLTCHLFVLSVNSFADDTKASLTTVTLTPQEESFLQNHPVITLGSDLSWQPLVTANPDGSISGYDADILQRINQLTGANFSLVVGDWIDMQTKAKAHDIDGLSTSAIIPERTSYLTFTNPYLTLQTSLFVSRGNPLSIKNFDDLKGKTLAIQKANQSDVELAKQFKHSTILYMDTLEELLSALSTGEVDATFGNAATLYLANKLGMPYLQAAFHLPQQLDLVFGIRKDWPEAVSILNKGLSLLTTHEKLRIQTYWFSDQSQADTIKENKALTLSNNEQLIVNNAPLRLCVAPNWLPFSSINSDGNYQGVTADIMSLIAERLDTKFILTPTSAWRESVDLIKHKKCDFITTITPTRQREEFLTFTQPVFTSPIVLATRLDQFFLPDLTSVGNKPIGIMKNSGIKVLIKNQYPNLNIIDVSSIQAGLALLSEQKIFGYIDSLEVIAHYVNKEHYINIKISSTLPMDLNLAIGVRKDWPQWPPLLNKAIQNISNEEIQQIRHRWIGIKYDEPIDYKVISIIITILGVLVFLVIYRYRVIAKYNTKLEDLNQKLAKQASTDQLTQLPNRYLLDQETLRVIAASQRYQEPFSAVLFDLDYFKKINDKYGHQVGDDVLIQVTQEMSHSIRDTDILGRWGGEEFLLVCPKTTLDGAIKLAEKIRIHIEQHHFIEGRKITLSAGVAEFNANENYHSLLKRLDDALYVAKNSGRNTVSTSKIETTETV
ncbi:diguanylate cyclase [Neptunomonas sp.]|uniref:transporter substrate-binding domain-containing diguanylate cyclase n=1 Tax=Neptunomonas sp. TaxID=1971898 RepID=UPI003565869D